MFPQEVLRRLGHRVVSSDEEEESQGKLDGPSEKAWGKRKATFYSTDFVDDELGGEYTYRKIKGDTVYRETLTKRFDEFDKSGSNRQTKATQNYTITISASIFYFNLLH